MESEVPAVEMLPTQVTERDLTPAGRDASTGRVAEMAVGDASTGRVAEMAVGDRSGSTRRRRAVGDRSGSTTRRRAVGGYDDDFGPVMSVEYADKVIAAFRASLGLENLPEVTVNESLMEEIKEQRRRIKMEMGKRRRVSPKFTTSPRIIRYPREEIYYSGPNPTSPDPPEASVKNLTSPDPPEASVSMQRDD